MRKPAWIGRLIRATCAPVVCCTSVVMVRDPEHANRYVWADYAAEFRCEYGERGLWVVTYFGGKVGFAPTLPGAREVIERLVNEAEP